MATSASFVMGALFVDGEFMIERQPVRSV